MKSPITCLSHREYQGESLPDLTCRACCSIFTYRQKRLAWLKEVRALEKLDLFSNKEKGGTFSAKNKLLKSLKNGPNRALTIVKGESNEF